LWDVTRTENSTYYRLIHPADKPRGYLLITKYNIFLKDILKSSIIMDTDDTGEMFLIALSYFIISKFKSKCFFFSIRLGNIIYIYIFVYNDYESYEIDLMKYIAYSLGK